jgi:hypothetical protein
MLFERNNTDVQKRKDRGSESEGKRRHSSLESKPWTPSGVALLDLLNPGGYELLVPSYSERELDRRSLSFADAARTHMVMDADLSRFKTIVLKRWPTLGWKQRHKVERLLPLRWVLLGG